MTTLQEIRVRGIVKDLRDEADQVDEYIALGDRPTTDPDWLRARADILERTITGA